jgi:hypothetical protein
MLMVVNPGIQVYVLDADGRVEAYIGDPGMVRQEQVDLQAVRDFLAGAALAAAWHRPDGFGNPAHLQRRDVPAARRRQHGRRATCTSCSTGRRASRWPGSSACAGSGRVPAWSLRQECW